MTLIHIKYIFQQPLAAVKLSLLSNFPLHIYAHSFCLSKCIGWSCKCISNEDEDVDPTSPVEFPN